MDSQSPTCEVCGGNTFEKDSGFLICVECQTQSQDYHQVIHDNNPVDENEDIELVEGTTIQDDYQDLTSWEAYTLVLKGLVKELISLGASPQIRIDAFQLWVRYLQKAEAVFISQTDKVNPKFPFNFNKKDADILFGNKNLRKEMFEKILNLKREFVKDSTPKSPSSSESECEGNSVEDHQGMQTPMQADGQTSKKKRTKLKDKIFQSQVKKHTQSAAQEGKKSKRQTVLPGVQLTSNSNKRLAKLLYSVRKEYTDFENDSDLRAKIMNAFRYDYENNHRKDAVINVTKIFSILRLALYFNRQDIMLSNLLRWISEGRLSVYRAHIFTNASTVEPIPMRHHTRAGLQENLHIICDALNIENIPTPNLYELADRFCLDLQLPMGFRDLVKGLISLKYPKMMLSNYSKQTFPDFECRVMAYVLCAAKLLFSLDGKTEESQSDYAENINKLGKAGDQELFSWRGWHRYITCRKAILSELTVSTFASDNGRLATDSPWFMDHWNRNKPCYKSETACDVSSMEAVINELCENDTSNDAGPEPHFPPSLTPHYSYAQTLLSTYPHLIPKKTRNILSYDFCNTSIQYLMDNNDSDSTPSYLKYAVLVDGVHEDTTFADISTSQVRGRRDYLEETNEVPSYAFVPVKVVDDKENWREKKQIRNFDPILKNVIEASDREEEIPRNLDTIYRPNKNYWFCHDRSTSRLSHHGFVEVTKNFSLSFKFLFYECSKMIGADHKGLYEELVLVERWLYKNYSDEKVAHSYKRKIENW